MGGGNVMHIFVVPSNTNVIYATKASSIFKSTNAGATWGNITGSLPVGSSQITGVCADNTNANNVYITLSGYTVGSRVYYSNNGGATWTNYSTGLPNIPVNCVVYKNNSPGAVYVGTDVGVYYRELSMSSWMPYFTGLPNVIVDELEIYYPTGKIRAATYGRGTWESDLYSNPSAAPFAFFTNAYSSACINVPFAFTDVSSNSPTSWSWSFPGGSPATSTSQNPNVTYTATGIYTVSLVATNTVGASSPYSTTISVVSSPTAVATSTGVCSGQFGVLTVNTNASLVTWPGGQTGNSATYSPTVTTVYSYTASSGACQTTGTATMTVGTPPPTPSISTSGNVLTSSSSTNYQWYLNGGPISGGTSQSFTATVSGWYSVWIDNGSGCQASSAAIYITVTDMPEFTAFNSLEISPNPARESLNLGFKSAYDKDISYSIKSALGQVIKTGKIRAVPGEKCSLGLNDLANGVYMLELSTDAASVNFKFIRQ
jgi:PKD repeat protein